ncbi:MAG TPA: hypothetical protein VE826_02395, partial [Dongiaceae bacterium]|nr:hypothetical protein [Dongiaceae bacterium]
MALHRLLTIAFACAFVATAGWGTPPVRGAESAPGIKVPAGFTAERIATVRRARELAVAPNGDLFVGTNGDAI